MLAAITFAASVVPTFVGGVFLSGLADRLSRRLVMITCDLVRVVLVLAMTLPGVPLAVLVILLFAVTMLGTPFTSARAASYSDILSDDRFVLGNAITSPRTRSPRSRASPPAVRSPASSGFARR